MSDRVLVTGVSGYLGGHIAADLLAHGYRVRGTVRSVTAELAAQLPDVELVTADLTDDAGWADAAADCRYVVHAASPFPAVEPDDENELVRPAVDGTLRVLRAAAAAEVERVVLTSSVAAVRIGHRDRVCTEADWSDPQACNAYEKSKTLAERAAWDVARERNIELVTINPGMILGPVQRAAVGTSVGALRILLAREMPAVPPIGFATVDVRDAAVAHRLGLEVPEAAGNRYIVAGESVSMTDMARILATRYRVPTRTMPALVLRLAARFDATARLAASRLGKREEVSADKARRELGWTMRPIEQTLLDTAESLVRLGVVDDPGRPGARRRAGGLRTQSASAA
ncbi:NAD-dependent epimerase/dehydratase family protein [Nocardia mexicana]|uniref:Nucleoside-diphosphate-sugar epimerase n=1 Tax=Nocardia mexicana TaxID=279262 RepID=A0A370H4P3_9NOCA|nr:NAD-dependent epimerase/dehydratase family protein [Nocardia mexicana]RDI51115.1 nucleoside-diphosphate-sugar epimerase [Nocardia mexicana]